MGLNHVSFFAVPFILGPHRGDWGKDVNTLCSFVLKSTSLELKYNNCPSQICLRSKEPFANLSGCMGARKGTPSSPPQTPQDHSYPPPPLCDCCTQYSLQRKCHSLNGSCTWCACQSSGFLSLVVTCGAVTSAHLYTNLPRALLSSVMRVQCAL
mmetsp:Transcript_123203/g.213662  ORF Transcript_123203/g.213662 Transcript_123203/m.213662 type:complete len:154 (-) Transcript_123203:57-518(-)